MVVPFDGRFDDACVGGVDVVLVEGRAMAWRSEYFALTALPRRAAVSIWRMAASALSGRESMYDSISERRAYSTKGSC